MALTVGAAVRGLAAIAERHEIARVAVGPAAGACRQVGDGEAIVWFRIGEFNRFVVGDPIGIKCRHCGIGSRILLAAKRTSRRQSGGRGNPDRLKSLMKCSCGLANHICNGR